ncbi:MAG TPA: peptide chain release factor 2 [Candidatus Hydrogenedentes bacterium]|nr:peptide chain release factor 2 [Candidatus Hydrogenedentota bacterium]
MYELEAQQTADHQTRLAGLRKSLNVDSLKADIAEVEASMAVPGFWDDMESAQKTVQRLKALKSVVGAPDELAREIEDAATLVEMGAEMEDASLAGEIAAMLDRIEAKLHRLELNSLFQDPRDTKTAMVNIHPGAGGTESCDWAEMLYRMFTRFCELREFDAEVLDYQPGEEAGLKSASLRVTGPYAFGTLKSEDGVHRLVRISPFDSAARRHTSFAAIEVLAEVDANIEIEIREEDIKLDVFRSSGAGGQKVNKTSSAVRLTHLPTGIVVSCQIERSQHRNRDTAMQMLRAKLYDIELKRKEAELSAMREGQQDVAWGSQIRSYVLHPYQMIKDHRTSYETGNVDRVLDGELDGFVEAYLKWNLERRSGARNDD